MTTSSGGSNRSGELRLIINHLLRHKLAVLGLIIVFIIAVVAVTAPWLSEHDARRTNLRHRFAAPSGEHPLGTDEVGRDVLTRLMYGGRISLSLGIIVAAISVIIGLSFGAISGYLGGTVDSLMMKFVDFMLCLPFFPILMVLVVVIGGGFWNLVLIMTIFGWMGVARIVRAEILAVKAQDFVSAARATGASQARILFRHLIPNVVAPVIVAATLAVGGAIIGEASLSFLGLGIAPPTPSWGNMLFNARAYFWNAPALVIWPGLLIFLTVLSVNFIGDGLRDALDPHQRRGN
ncbi:ABC transporter permease [Candidatus Bipolaricaulota bacterium]|nr:ABC transporter permease [Candidatus Bipolaricaulota bacterium]HBR10348.1 ABC transporter permease [Candidatus Acetothermia bacterium]